MKFLFKKEKSLSQILAQHEGKIFDKWKSYIEVYEDEFAKFRNMNGSILEIGIQNCGSLEIWAKYFKDARKIVGVDIVEDLKSVTFADTRIDVTICNSNDLIKANALADLRPTIVIDDGSHQSFDIVRTFLDLFPILENGGIYVVEDLCCSYWEQFNENASISSMEFFKLLVDLVNMEHWEKNGEVKDFEALLSDFIDPAADYDLENIVRKVKSIKFLNSMCFISKCNDKQTSSIGERTVFGSYAPLGFQAKDGSSLDEIKGTAMKRVLQIDLIKKSRQD